MRHDRDRMGRHGIEHGGRMRAGFMEGIQSTSRRFLKPLLLLLLAESPCHGYELMSRLGEFGVDQGTVDPSVLYRFLRMMGREGLAESCLNDSGAGPARKVYSLTPEGREVLDLWAANIKSLQTFITDFSERYDALDKEGES